MKASVIYGGRWGGTVSIAEKIGQVLTKEGYDVDVVDPGKSLKPLVHLTSSLLEAAYELTNGPEKPSSFFRKTLNF